MSDGGNGSDAVNSGLQPGELEELKLFLSADLYRAWQRCSWVVVSETGRSRTEIMAEMVRDFLVKHGC